MRRHNAVSLMFLLSDPAVCSMLPTIGPPLQKITKHFRLTCLDVSALTRAFSTSWWIACKTNTDFS